MPKLKIIYILSLAILLVLIVFTGFKLTATAGRYSEIRWEQLVRTEDGWTIQFEIINREGRDTQYVINVCGKSEELPYDKRQCQIPDGGVFTYTYHIRRHVIGADKVNITVGKEGEDTPFEQTAYYLK